MTKDTIRKYSIYIIGALLVLILFGTALIGGIVTCNRSEAQAGYFRCYDVKEYIAYEETNGQWYLLDTNGSVLNPDGQFIKP